MIRTERKTSAIGTIVGFLTGVGVGVLFATKSSREDLVREGCDQLEDAEEKMVSEGGKEPFYESGKYI